MCRRLASTRRVTVTQYGAARVRVWRVYTEDVQTETSELVSLLYNSFTKKCSRLFH